MEKKKILRGRSPFCFRKKKEKEKGKERRKEGGGEIGGSREGGFDSQPPNPYPYSRQEREGGWGRSPATGRHS